jgi:DNA-binding transcriptional ArsR family regulator
MFEHRTSHHAVREAEASAFRLLGDPTRLHIVDVLGRGPRSVTELCREVGSPQPTVSRHLRVLREGGVVVATRRGNSVTYRLKDHHVLKVVDAMRRYLVAAASHHANIQ